jgi:hypothetical protein
MRLTPISQTIQIPEHMQYLGTAACSLTEEPINKQASYPTSIIGGALGGAALGGMGGSLTGGIGGAIGAEPGNRMEGFIRGAKVGLLPGVITGGLLGGIQGGRVHYALGQDFSASRANVEKEIGESVKTINDLKMEAINPATYPSAKFLIDADLNTEKRLLELKQKTLKKIEDAEKLKNIAAPVAGAIDSAAYLALPGAIATGYSGYRAAKKKEPEKVSSLKTAALKKNLIKSSSIKKSAIHPLLLRNLYDIPLYAASGALSGGLIGGLSGLIASESGHRGEGFISGAKTSLIPGAIAGALIPAVGGNLGYAINKPTLGMPDPYMHGIVQANKITGLPFVLGMSALGAHAVKKKESSLLTEIPAFGVMGGLFGGLTSGLGGLTEAEKGRRAEGFWEGAKQGIIPGAIMGATVPVLSGKFYQHLTSISPERYKLVDDIERAKSTFNKRVEPLRQRLTEIDELIKKPQSTSTNLKPNTQNKVVGIFSRLPNKVEALQKEKSLLEKNISTLDDWHNEALNAEKILNESEQKSYRKGVGAGLGLTGITLLPVGYASGRAAVKEKQKYEPVSENMYRVR